MIPSEVPYYAGIGAVLALLVWSACRLRASRQRFAYRALLVFAALLAATVVLADLKHSTGKVVMTKLIFALSGATVVVSLRLLWAAWQAPHWKGRLRLT